MHLSHKYISIVNSELVDVPELVHIPHTGDGSALGRLQQPRHSVLDEEKDYYNTIIHPGTPSPMPCPARGHVPTPCQCHRLLALLARKFSNRCFTFA